MGRSRAWWLGCLATVLVFAYAAPSRGQLISRPNNDYYSRLNPAARVIGQARPKVSPYLNLLRSNSFNVGVPNYQSLVRPQVDQSRFNARTAGQLGRLQRQVGGLAQTVGPGSLGIVGGGMRPTGRPAGSASLPMYYGNTLHYYGNRLTYRQGTAGFGGPRGR